jgi:hypothetical protein
MSCCLCQTVPRGAADVLSKNYDRDNCLVVHNRAQHVIETCSCCGHRVDPLGVALCQNTELISSALKFGFLVVIDQFDGTGRILNKE